MSHELLIPADALARINMLFRRQDNAAETERQAKTKDLETRTEVMESPTAKEEMTNVPVPARD